MLSAHPYDTSYVRTRPLHLPADTTSKCSLSRVRLDAQGYDPTGRYWGLGQPLWLAEGQDGEHEGIQRYVRASSREAAKALFPRARWFR